MTSLKEKLATIAPGLRAEISSLRTGRATPALVEDLPVEVYGSTQPLKTLAAISTPEARQLLIQPWDKSVLPAIERAIQSSQLGVNPIADKDTIRLSIPTLTEERKRDLVKILKEKLEAARIHIRRVRDEAMKEIDLRKIAKEISEDQKFRERQDVEKLVGDVQKSVDDIGAKKEHEIMTG